MLSLRTVNARSAYRHRRSQAIYIALRSEIAWSYDTCCGYRNLVLLANMKKAFVMVCWRNLGRMLVLCLQHWAIAMVAKLGLSTTFCHSHRWTFLMEKRTKETKVGDFLFETATTMTLPPCDLPLIQSLPPLTHHNETPNSRASSLAIAINLTKETHANSKSSELWKALSTPNLLSCHARWSSDCYDGVQRSLDHYS